MKREDVLAKLTEATLQLTDSESWQRWLRTRRSFHSYSFRNQILISVQRPTVKDPVTDELNVTAEYATRVAGFRAWQKLGYQVVKGANGIGILAPCRPSKKQLEAAKNGGEEPKVFFTGANVFDISQTVPIEGKAQELDAPGIWGGAIGPDDPDLFADLCLAAINHLGLIDVIREDLPGKARGAYAPWAESITVDDQVAGAEAVAVFVHELAHHVDHTLPGRIDRYDIGELVAESAAFMVCDSLGIDSSGAAVFYVAHWTKDIEDPKAALSAVAGRVLEVAAAIEEALRSQRAESCMTSST
ncbi:MAG TPA: ArdC-like ssDNA-binding domain-containing protein [Solirubrobacterales bacterium]